jgi:hypothetical protein
MTSPPSSLRVVRDCSGSQTPMRNLTQYLEQLVASGTQPGELAVIPAAGPAPHLAAAGPATAPTGWPTSSTSRGWQDSHLHTKGWQLDR